jgi:chorismate mutase
VTGPEERFAALRDEIAANDRALVEGVNKRLQLVTELWRLKEELGTARLDPERERRLREELQRSNTGPLSPEGLDELVGALLELTKRELGGPATPAPDRPRSKRTRPA